LKSESSLHSVGGWLLYYCVSRAVFEPIYFIYTFRKLQSPFEMVLELGFGIAGLFAVFLILKHRDSAHIAVGLDLSLRSCFSAAVFLRLLLHPLRNGNTDLVHVLSACIVGGAGICFALVWFFYFKLSVRVHKVLGKNVLAKDHPKYLETDR
jgi:hypothetical protein